MADVQKDWPIFYAYGPYDLRRNADGSFDYASFRADAVERDDWKTEPGCYLLCRRTRSGLKALYIGKSERSILKRIYEHRARIAEVFEEIGSKTSLAMIMLHYNKSSGRWNGAAIDSLETELIQIAMRNGIKLDNIQKTKKRRVRIAGVKHGGPGRPNGAAPKLCEALGEKG